jgi:hypothetical protein
MDERLDFVPLQGRGGPGVGPNLGTVQHPSGAIPGMEMFSGTLLKIKIWYHHSLHDIV